jgi:Transcriptional regulators
MSRLPTVLDVARAAGVSRQTVSNVLNSPGVVRPDTRERVQAAIADLGYRPHASARRLRTQKSSTIGIRLDPMTDGISGAVLDRFLHALTEQADAIGLRILLFTATDPDDEIRQFSRLAEGADVDAFVLTSTFHGDPRTQWLIDHGQSFVTFGRPWGIDDLNDPQHLWVDVDGRTGTRAATEFLLGKGMRRVGYIGWPQGSGTGDERFAGWRDAMLAAPAAPQAPDGGTTPDGLDELDELHEIASDSVGDGREAARRLLARVPALDAIVTASDGLAIGALVGTAGAVPVVGFDNTPIAQAIGFSSVEQRLDLVAAGVLELLTGSHGGRVGSHGDAADPRHRLVQPELIERPLRPMLG